MGRHLGDNKFINIEYKRLDGRGWACDCDIGCDYLDPNLAWVCRLSAF
jgi:hypothetical protein